MRLINKTNIPDRVIKYFLRDLGIIHSKGTLTLELGDFEGRGLCRMIDSSTFQVYLSSEAGFSTLAHELKHVEQHVNGLSEYMRLERELTEYKDRWHEIEAREYSRRWKGKRI